MCAQTTAMQNRIWGSEKEDLVRGRTGECELEEVVAFDLGFEAQVGLGQAGSVGRAK